MSCHFARAVVSLIFSVVEAEGSAFTFPEFLKALHSSVARAVFGVSSQTLDAIYMRLIVTTTQNPSLDSMRKPTAMAPGKTASAGKRVSSRAHSILADVSHAGWALEAQAPTRESAARLLLNILGIYCKILVYPAKLSQDRSTSSMRHELSTTPFPAVKRTVYPSNAAHR
jgi:hypothetical protein